MSIDYDQNNELEGLLDNLKENTPDTINMIVQFNSWLIANLIKPDHKAEPTNIVKRLLQT